MGLVPARAQYIPIYIVPPANPYAWQGLSPTYIWGQYDYVEGGYNWGTDSEWLGPGAPLDGVDVLFGNYGGGLQRQLVLSNQDLNLRSLWFEAGTWYFIGGSSGKTLTLGSGNTDMHPHLLVVNSQDLQEASEHAIAFGEIHIDSGISGIGRIENYSEGGLALSGLINLNDQHIQIGGMGATALVGTLTGGGIIDVGLFGGADTENLPQPHLILSADNRDWNGQLRVNARGFTVLKTDQALGYGITQVHTGTLAFRSHLGQPLYYDATVNQLTKHIQVGGKGLVRQVGTVGVGSLYNDGGENHINMPIYGDPTSTVYTPNKWVFIGSRGDRDGGLYLTGKISNTYNVVKVGPGLLVLNNGSNYWDGGTQIEDGVVRFPTANTLPQRNFWLAGGIIELGFDLKRGLNTGPYGFGFRRQGNDRGSTKGGFSAYGADRSVTIVQGGQTGSPAVDSVTWNGTFNFLQDGWAFLLSSRYANANITFTTAIKLGSQLREVRVERGVGNAHGILSGGLSGTGGLMKTGPGLLEITGANTYTGATVIRGGALRGTIDDASNIQLFGGVLGIDDDFARNLGSAGTLRIQWAGSGGFAAYDSTYIVNINEGNLTWGQTPYFVAANEELRFGHYTATGTVQWVNRLDLGSGGTRTMRIERGSDLDRADVWFDERVVSSGANLKIVGDGRIDFSQISEGGSSLEILGAELRLNGKAGAIMEAEAITLGHNGTLYLDDVGTHASDFGGARNEDRIWDKTSILFSGGTLRYRAYKTHEKVGALIMDSGQNQIDLLPYGDGNYNDGIQAFSLERADTSRSTLHITGFKKQSITFDKPVDTHGINDFDMAKIIAWATFNSDWAVPYPSGSSHSIWNYQALYDYQTGPSGVWDGRDNVRLDSAFGSTNQILSENREINSLILYDRNLNLNGSELAIRSGGLMSAGTGTRLISGSGFIVTTHARPLYIHTQSNLTIDSGALVLKTSDLVKSHSGTLTLGGSVNHHAVNVYIHRGTLDLHGGTLRTNHIVIGDGGGNARLKLAPHRWEQIRDLGGGVGEANITLNGTPYDPRGPDYGGDQAVLQMGGNTKLHLSTLHIENRGTIDWVGGEVGLANILWVDCLTFSGPDARLFMRNWYEYEDILLVRKTGCFDFDDLGKVVFEGYENYTTTYRDWDKDYYQITPFNHLESQYGDPPCPECPEPSTYGALLGTLGAGLYLYRRRRKQGAAKMLPPLPA